MDSRRTLRVDARSVDEVDDITVPGGAGLCAHKSRVNVGVCGFVNPYRASQVVRLRDQKFKNSKICWAKKRLIARVGKS